MSVLPPSRDPFYVAVDAVGPPGRVLRHRRVPSPGTVPAQAWQLVHVSTGTTGTPTVLSGTLLVPTTAWDGTGPRPLLTYGVGVHGLGRDSAPSYWLRRGTEPELAQVELALALGWAVAVTDGEGLGMPGPHTYGAGIVGGRAMLDVARSARALLPELAASPVLAWGYSEGGRCAVFAAEEQPSYAPELPLVAVAAGGVPSDLHAVARSLDGGPFSGLNLAVLVGLVHAHARPGLWDVLTPSGLRAAQRVAGLDVVGLVLEGTAPLAAHTVREDPWDDPAWRALLRQEEAGQRTPQVPIHLYHVVGDEIVPDHLLRRLASAYRRGGADVTVSEVDASDHLAGAAVAAPAMVEWLTARQSEASASLNVVDGRITAAVLAGSGR